MFNIIILIILNYAANKINILHYSTKIIYKVHAEKSDNVRLDSFPP